jgi:hypothetical protein
MCQVKLKISKVVDAFSDAERQFQTYIGESIFHIICFWFMQNIIKLKNK